MLAQANQQITGHLATIAQLEADNTDLLAEVMDNDQLEKWYDAKLAVATSKIGQLQKENEGLKRQAGRLASNANAANNILRSSKSNLAASELSNTQLRSSLAASDQKLGAAERKNEKLEEQLRAAKAEAAALRRPKGPRRR